MTTPLGAYMQALTLEAMTGAFDWTSDTIKGVLGDSGGWSFDATTQLYLADAITDGFTEMTAGGYARQTLASKTATADFNPNLRTVLDAATINFGAIAGTQNYDTFILIKFVTNNADSPLLGAWDLGAQTTNGGTISIATIGGEGYINSFGG
jgi:hypothetical protein